MSAPLRPRKHLLRDVGSVAHVVCRQHQLGMRKAASAGKEAVQEQRIRARHERRRAEEPDARPDADGPDTDPLPVIPAPQES